MSHIKTLSETEGRARMINLSTSVEIQKPTTPINRTARELRLASAPTGGSRVTTTTTCRPKSLAAAIKAELEAGNTKDPAAVAAEKFPHLAAAWLAELQNCADSESAL